MNDTDKTLRVYLVDDHAMFRAGVRSELGTAVEVVGEAGTVAEAIAGIEQWLPDVVLLDVHMPDGGGRAVLERVRASRPDVKFLALSVSDAAEDVIGLIRAGARGYVTKTIAADSWSRRSSGWPRATRCSRPGWRVSCWTPSRPSRRPRPAIRSSTS